MQSRFPSDAVGIVRHWTADLHRYDIVPYRPLGAES